MKNPYNAKLQSRDYKMDILERSKIKLARASTARRRQCARNSGKYRYKHLYSLLPVHSSLLSSEFAIIVFENGGKGH